MKRAILCAVLFLSEPALRATEGDGTALTQERAEFQEITMHLRGNKGVTAALRDAAAKGETVTGVADFDSLSAVYGLMGIYREGGMSSCFYGYRFRLAFPAATDVEAISRAYGNLPYIKSVAPSSWLLGIHYAGGGERLTRRIFAKVVLGGALTAASAVVFLALFISEAGSDVIDLTIPYTVRIPSTGG